MSLISKLAAASAGAGEPLLAPEFVMGGTLSIFTFTVEGGFVNATSTYKPAGAPTAAGGREAVRTNSKGDGVISTGFSRSGGLRCASFDTTTTPWTMYNLNGIPVGSRGNALADTCSVNSRRTGNVCETAVTNSYRTGGFTSNSWSVFSPRANSYWTRHNRLYGASGSTIYVWNYTTTSPSQITGHGLTGSGARGWGDGSDRKADPTTFSGNSLALNEVVATNAGKIWIAESGGTTYTEIYDAATDDGLSAASAAVSRDGTRVAFTQASDNTVHIYKVDPDSETAEFSNSFTLATGVGTANTIRFGPSRNLLFTNNAGGSSHTQIIAVDTKGNVLDTASAGAYGMDVSFDIADYDLGE